MRPPLFPRKSRLLAFLVLAAALSAECARAQEKPKPLRWGADEEGGAPYITKDLATGKYVGFEVDLADALSKELDRPIEFKQYAFTSLIQGLQRGDIDLAMNGIEVTEDRKALIQFSRPYYIYRLQLVTRRDDERFKSVKDLEGKRDVKVGTLANTAASRLLEKRGIATELYDDQVSPYRNLALGRIDAVLLDLPIALYVVKKNAELHKKLQFTGEPVDPGEYAIALRKNDTELAQQIDAALGKLIHNGQLQRIYEKWDLWNDDQKLLEAESTGLGPISAGAEDRSSASALERLGWYLGQLLAAAVFTVVISVMGMALAVLLALPIVVARLYGPAPVRWLALAYVEFFRGIPILLLLIFLYYGLPLIAQQHQFAWSLKMTPVQAAVLGFGLNYAAYEAEIYRTGISAVPAGQWEAAASLGMGSVLTFRRIILPQAMRVIVPPMTSDFVALFKDTSVASVITVVELTKQYTILTGNPANYPDYLEIALLTALLYLSMSVPLGRLSRRLEKRWGTAA
jgi:polar amino acid transport system substrate-binding protein